jgi:hypothetical protein
MGQPQGGHDVFLTYARNNAVLARAVFKFLRSAGLRVWFDEQSVAPGSLWMAATARGIAQASHLLILLTETTPVAWQRAEFDFAARAAARYPNLEIVPLIREGFAPDPAFVDWLDRYDPVSLPSDKQALETHLRELVDRLAAPAGMPAMPPNDTTCPYPVLQPYGLAESRYYFGRERELVEATARLGEQAGGASYTRWLRVEGAGSIGKTSFVRAGLAPCIVRGAVAGAPGDWRVLALRPSEAPFEALAGALIHSFSGTLGQTEILESLKQSTGLADLIREHLPPDQGLLLVLDHLEDVLTAQSPEEVQQFDGLLAEALADFDRRLLLISTTRSDLVGGTLAALPQCAAQSRACSGVLELGGFTRAGLRDIIEGPPRLVGRPLPADLSARLRRDAERWSTVPARLSWMLSTLASQGRASLKRYEAMGGLAEGLGRTLDRRLESLGSDDRDRARSLLTALVGSGRGQVDRLVPLTIDEAVFAAGAGPRAEALIERLGEVDEAGSPPVIHTTRDGPQEHVRLVHAALLNVWPQLHQWIEADRAILERRADVEQAAVRWHVAGADAQVLPAGALLLYYAGGDLPEAQRVRLRASLRTRTRHFVQEAEAAQGARQAATAAKDSAKAKAEQARQSTARAKAASHVLRLRLIVTLGFALAGAAGWLAWKADQREHELAEQVRYAASQRAGAEQAMRDAEEKHLDAEQLRKSAERDRKIVERERRTADRLGAEAQKSADAVLGFAIEAAVEADVFFSRVPGKDGKYARRMYAQAVLARLNKRVESEPENRRLRYLLARQYTLLGDLAADVGRHRAARPHFEQAVVVLKTLTENADALTDRPVLETMAYAQTVLGRYQSNPRRGTSDPVAAAAHHRTAIAIWGQLAKAYADDETLTNHLADAQADLGVALLRQGQGAQAQAILQTSVTTTRTLLARKAKDPVRVHALARRLAFLADAVLAAGDGQAALGHYREAMALLNPYQLGTPESRPLERSRAQIKRRLKAAREQLAK